MFAMKMGKIGKIFLKAVAFILGFCCLLYLVKAVVGPFDFFHVAVFFTVFVFAPIVILIVFWSKKTLRWYLLACTCILVFWSIYSFGSWTKIVENDFSTYMIEDLEHTELYMPSKESLTTAKIVAYEDTKNVFDDYRMIKFTAQYSNEDFLIAKEKMDDQYQTYITQESYSTAFDDVDFYLDGHRFFCVMEQNGVKGYAVAYHASSESNSITYLFFEDDIGLFSWAADIDLMTVIGKDRVIPLN